MNKKWLIGIIIFISLIILGLISLYIVKFVFFASLDGGDQTKKTYPEANLNYPLVKVMDIAEPGNYNLKAFVMYVDYCPPCPPNAFCETCDSINGIIISDDNLTGKIDKENFKNELFNTNETIIFSGIPNPKTV